MGLEQGPKVVVRMIARLCLLCQLTPTGYHMLRPKDGLGRIPLWEV
jgi:hypothetical protein